MTPERVKELLPVFEAYAEGKEIQYRRYPIDPWTDSSSENPDFAFYDGYSYRVKPTPTKYEIWVNAYLNIATGKLWPSASQYPSEEEAILHKYTFPNHVFAGTHKIEFTYEQEN